jgi:hypothetical protein
MAKRKCAAEEIVTVLPVVRRHCMQARRESETTEQTYYRWRKEYGGLKAGAGQTAQGAWRVRTRCSNAWWLNCNWTSKFCRAWLGDL